MTEATLRFDGYKLSLLESGRVIKSWDAVSGRDGYNSPTLQDRSFVGPIPEGNWRFEMSSIQRLTAVDEALGPWAGALCPEGHALGDMRERF